MLLAAVQNFVSLFVIVFEVLILIRVVMSWINPSPTGGFGGFINDLTEPILAPLRRLLPGSQTFDLSPLIAFILLEVINELTQRIQ